MNLKKLLSTGLALAGIGTWLALAPLVIVPHANRPTAGTITDVTSESVNVLAPDGQGSGIIFHKGNRTYILTAAHVITDENGAQIPNDGLKVTQGTKSWDAVVVNRDVKRDLALLRLTVDHKVGRSARLAKLSASFPVGTHLLHIGNTLGFNGSYLEGLLSAVGRFDGEFSQSSILCWPGSSGGGIFTEEGTLVGVLTQGVGPGLNFFIPHNLVWRWAVENDTQWLFE